MLRKYTLFVVSFFLSFPAAFAADNKGLERLPQVLAKALPRMACNIAPLKEKAVRRTVDGREETILLKPDAGAIVASPSMDQPDYYFHWNRDSALVVSTLIRLAPRLEGTAAGQKMRSFLKNFVRFSAALQESESPYGLGEVRYNVDGSVDDIAWSRPQHDGPALRALAMMDYLKLDGLDPMSASLARQVLKIDLDHLSYAYEAKGYDLWEYSFGHHFFTRLVQLSALERGIAEAPRFLRKEWRTAAASLRGELAKHWDGKGGFYHFSLGKVTNWEGNEVPEVGAGRDASAVLAANYAGFNEGDYSLNDPKVLSSAWVLEEYFRGAYPFNKDHAFAPGIGRHPNDDYYGGNAWYVLTSGYAELYYGLAARVQDENAGLVVGLESKALLESALGRGLRVGERLRPEDGAKFVAKGDGFMATMMDTVGSDGMMAEQFSKENGEALSAVDLTWSYSSFLSAVLARETAAPSGLVFASFSYDCAGK